ncbi:hypothetical protein QZH41_010555, partial [Actinostola sp. cb2023]
PNSRKKLHFIRHLEFPNHASDTFSGSISRHGDTFKMASQLEATQIQHLFREKFVAKRKSLLAKALNFPEFDEDDDLRSAILIDIYYDALSFAVNEGLPWNHIAVFFQIIQKTLLNIAGKSLWIINRYDSYSFVSYFAAIGQTLPQAIQLFRRDLQDCSYFLEASLQSLVDYIFSTFFQHYKLHRYVLTCDRGEDRTKFTMVVEPPLEVACLSEGIPKVEWDEKQRLKEIDEMEERQKTDRQAHYKQLLEEAAKHLEIPFEGLTTNDQPVNKGTLTNIVKDVANAQASVTQTLLQETLDEMKDTLEFQHMRVNVMAEFENTEKSTRKKSGASSGKSKRK